MSSLKKMSFMVAFLIPIATVIGYFLGGYWNWLTPVLVFAILPLLDLVIGQDASNPEETDLEGLQSAFYFRFLTYAWAYAQVGLVVWGAYVVATDHMNNWSWAGFILSIGLNTGGIGITVAHELGHKKTKIEQFYSKLILMTVCYMHFFIEHNKGHHVRVSTPDDPASSRKGESFYQFYPRTVLGSYLSAWKIENETLRKKGLKPFSLSNSMIWFHIAPLAFASFLTLGGWFLTGGLNLMVPAFFFGQSIIAFSLLELVNYIEHYGLRRKQNENGRYERVTPIHSWNNNHFISNAFLFHLQRHSDHHANAGRRYSALRHFEESPQLPAGYELMILLALFPPVWRAVMDKKLEAWEESYGYAEAKAA